MAVPVMKKTGESMDKGKQVVEEGNSSPPPLLMVNNNGKGKQVQVFVDYHNPPPLPESSSSSARLPQWPPGYRFAPKESELIIDYLHKKVMGKPVNYHPNPVVERDLYGNEEPSQICRALGKAEHEDFYVFTLLRSKFGGTHMSRRAGNGTWKGNHKAQPVYDDNDLTMTTPIGFRTTLNFFDNMSKRTSWIMHQYALPDQQQGWTLCRIHNEDQAKKKRRFSAVPCAPQYPTPSSSAQPIIHEAPAPAAKRPRTNAQTSASSQLAQTSLQCLPSDDCVTGYLSFLLNDVDYSDDMDPFLESSHTPASQNAYDNLASLLSPVAGGHVTLSALSATEFASSSSSSSHPQEDLPSSSQPQGPDTIACNNNNWCPWLIDENMLPF